MSMSKKDYVAIAAIIKLKGSANSNRIALDQHRRQVLKGIAEDIATYCGNSSQPFDRARFLAACGVAD